MLSRDLVVITRECPGAIRVGKPLDLAVDGVTATTDATQHPGTGRLALHKMPVPNLSRPV
jgi:hypothetical protein